MILPNFIIPGVARSGTTSLYYYLSQHPDIGFAKPKEPKYFSSLHLSLPQNGPGDNTLEATKVKSYDQYVNLFQHLGDYKIRAEASSDYLYYYKHTIPEIKKTLNDPKILISIRNPIDRAFSAYNNLIRDQRETLSFEDGLKAESERLTNNWDWMWAYRAGSLYADAISAFKSEFSQVKVILFEEFESDTANVLQDIFSFLQIDPSVNIDYSSKYSHSGRPKRKWMNVLTNKNNPVMAGLRRFALAIIPRNKLENMASKMLDKDKISSELRFELHQEFTADIQKLEHILNRDLSIWSVEHKLNSDGQ